MSDGVELPECVEETVGALLSLRRYAKVVDDEAEAGGTVGVRETHRHVLDGRISCGEKVGKKSVLCDLARLWMAKDGPGDENNRVFRRCRIEEIKPILLLDGLRYHA